VFTFLGYDPTMIETRYVAHRYDGIESQKWTVASLNACGRGAEVAGGSRYLREGRRRIRTNEDGQTYQSIPQRKPWTNSTDVLELTK
jgi:hypothetical protein